MFLIEKMHFISSLRQKIESILMHQDISHTFLVLLRLNRISHTGLELTTYESTI